MKNEVNNGVKTQLKYSKQVTMKFKLYSDREDSWFN